MLIILGEKISANEARSSLCRIFFCCATNTSGSSIKRRMKITNKAGKIPSRNSERQAHSGASSENISAYSSADTPQPMAHPACTMPTALPRSLARITSPIRMAPAVHSPPMPKPIRPRATSSSVKFCASPHSTVKTANHRMVICSALTRPMRSDRMPASQPPAAEVSKVTVPIKPASPLDKPQVAISVGITKLRNWVSMASSA